MGVPKQRIISFLYMFNNLCIFHGNLNITHFLRKITSFQRNLGVYVLWCFSFYSLGHYIRIGFEPKLIWFVFLNTIHHPRLLKNKSLATWNTFSIFILKIGKSMNFHKKKIRFNWEKTKTIYNCEWYNHPRS